MPGREQVETNLADLGVSTVAEKIPTAMDHYLGFELITSNDENTRAAGILGFQVGNELLYVPVLFLNGKVKGTEVLYLKKSDVFTSNTKQWWEYLTTRTPGVVGEPGNLPPGLSTQPSASQMRVFNQPPAIGGKMAAFDDLSIYPDLDQLPGWKDNTTWNKKGSLFPDAYDVLNRAVKEATRDEMFKVASRADFNVPAVLKSLGRESYVSFMKWACDRPEVLDALGRYYDLDELKISFEAPQAKQAAAPTEQKLARYHAGDIYDEAKAAGLTVEEKELLMRSGSLILDKRAEEEKTPVYKEDYLSRFNAPHESGFYEIVNKFGDLQKVFVAHHPFVLEHPKRALPGHLILDPESGIYQVPVSDDQIMVRHTHSMDEAAWKSKFGKLPSISNASPKKTYMLVSERLWTSAPFKVVNKIGSGKDVNLVVRTPYEIQSRVPDHSRMGLWSEETTIKVIDRDDMEIQRIGSVVFVPKGWKLIEVDEDSSTYGFSGEQTKKDTFAKITPGSSGTVTAALVNKGVFELHISKNASDDYIFSVGNHASPFFKEDDARWFLMSKLGMGLEDAQDCLNIGQHCRSSCFAKLGYGFAQMFGGDQLPPVDNEIGYNNSGVREVQSQVQQQPIELARQEVPNSDPMNNDDANWDRIKPQHLDFLMRAADSGSKAVFDPAMIGMILRTTRASSQVEQWLPDLVNALDTKARLLLLFYWHNSEFAEDYGKDEMAEFEDQLMNSIKVDGTVVLFLKQKAGDSPNARIDAFEGD